MKFKVGDKVKVTSNEGGNRFNIGDVVTITKVFEDHYKADSEDDFWFVSDKSIELYVEETKEPLKDSQWAYRAIHQHIAEMLQVYLDSGEADVDFYESELKLAALMREIESHTDLE